MILFKTLRWKNFLSTGNNWSELDFLNDKTTLVVGHNGAGKSTIINLINRFYEIDSGDILIDGINIKEFTLLSLRDQIGYVSQDVHLFSDTILLLLIISLAPDLIKSSANSLPILISSLRSFSRLVL